MTGLPSADSLTDAVGTVHPQAGPDTRIVSLVPSITELLFDLGLGPSLVGRTAYCVLPADRVKAVPKMGGTKQVHMDRLLAARPTHVIVNIDETPRAIADEIAAAGVRVVVTHPVDVADNLPLFRLLGGIFGRDAEAKTLARRFEEAMARLVGTAAALPERRVLYLIWTNPWMTVSRDTYVARMLELVRWQTIADDPAVRYPAVEITEALLATTDAVLFSSEPFPFRQRHLDAFAAAFPAHAAKARFIDGQMTSWYGSRSISGLDYLLAEATGVS